MPESGSGRVFISYRRQETAWPARQLYELLCERFGADQVFKDIDTIEPGDDFVDRVTRAVGSCDVLLALIGERWLTIADENGRPRLSDPEDFVRLEIETALSRSDVRVIPILVDTARMPRADELGPDLRPLVRRQAVQLSATDFDASRLMRVVEETLSDMHGKPATPPTGFAWNRTRTVVAATISVGLLLGALFLWRVDQREDPSTRDSTDVVASAGPGTPSSASASPVDPDGPDVLAHRGGWEDYPLESLRALTSAAASGYAVETDVRWTRDDVPVIVHDEAATKGLECASPVNVSKTTWSELSRLCTSTPGPKDKRRYPIATYQDAMEALAAASSRAWVYVEVKVDQTPAQLREFLDVIRREGLSKRTVVTSFAPNRLVAVHDAAPDLRLMRFLDSKPVPPQKLAIPGLWGVAIDPQIATRLYVRQLKSAGLTVVDYLLNEERDWAQAKSVGVDKVLTDNPQAYSAWLAHQ